MKANKFNLNFYIQDKDHKTNQVFIPEFGNDCLCCNKPTSNRKRKRLDGEGGGQFYGGKIDIPVCSECKHHVPSNYQPLISVSIFMFLFSLIFLAVCGFELHMGTVILLGLGGVGMVFVLYEFIKGKRWIERGHFPNYHINPIPNNFIFTTNNLSLAKKIVALNQKPGVHIETNDLLKGQLNK